MAFISPCILLCSIQPSIQSMPIYGFSDAKHPQTLPSNPTETSQSPPGSHPPFHFHLRASCRLFTGPKGRNYSESAPDEPGGGGTSRGERGTPEIHDANGRMCFPGLAECILMPHPVRISSHPAASYTASTHTKGTRHLAGCGRPRLRRIGIGPAKGAELKIAPTK